MAIQIDGDSGVSGVNGSATTPALQGTDSNTGIVFGTDTVQVATGGSTRATVDSSGNLGVGTSSPSALLHLSKTTNSGDVGLIVQNTGTSNNTASVYLNKGSGGEADHRIQNDTGGNLTFARGTDESSYTEQLRINASGQVLINTTSAANSDTNVEIHDTSVPEFAFARNDTTISANNGLGRLRWYGNDSNGTFQECARLAAEADGTHQTDDKSTRLVFSTTPGGSSSPSERMRITNDGDIKIAMGNFGDNSVESNSTNDGIYIDRAGNTKLQVARSGGVPFSVNRIGNDGSLVDFYQQGNLEGGISVSGSTVSYNGAHLSRWSQLASGAERTEILRGSVLSNLDEMCEWAHAAQDAVLYTEEDELPEGASVGDVKTPAVDAYTEDNEQLNRMKVSDVEGDVNVAGVFQGWDDDDDTYTNDFYCAMTGDFVIRIAQGTTVARGDLLMSAGDGTAKPQDDDIVRSKTIAKVTSTTVSTTYTDGSYCVPCVLMAC